MYYIVIVTSSFCLSLPCLSVFALSVLQYHFNRGKLSPSHTFSSVAHLPDFDTMGTLLLASSKSEEGEGEGECWGGSEHGDVHSEVDDNRSGGAQRSRGQHTTHSHSSGSSGSGSSGSSGSNGSGASSSVLSRPRSNSTGGESHLGSSSDVKLRRNSRRMSQSQSRTGNTGSELELPLHPDEKQDRPASDGISFSAMRRRSLQAKQLDADTDGDTVGNDVTLRRNSLRRDAEDKHGGSSGLSFSAMRRRSLEAKQLDDLADLDLQEERNAVTVRRGSMSTTTSVSSAEAKQQQQQQQGGQGGEVEGGARRLSLRGLLALGTAAGDDDETVQH